ncbi:MAG: prepilin-type N-terminal cleavage/methylation domain-containing protein [Candidatus Saccharibacteria bacterium]
MDNNSKKNNSTQPKFSFIHKPAFTIIEVIIVLVIGAVIMLAVFLVVPQLQRTQRNTNRQNAARRVLTAVEQVRTTTGAYPVPGTAASTGINCFGTLSTASNCTIITSITGDVNTTAGNTQYTIVIAPQTSGDLIADTKNIYLNNSTTANSGCNTSKKLVTTSAIADKFAVAVAQETASSQTGDTFCLTYP